MNTQELHKYADESFSLCKEILKNKGHDYSGKEDPFKNFRNSQVVGVDPIRGIMVRMMDKISRLSQLADSDPKVTDESFEDTCMDLVNYTILLSAMRVENIIKDR